MNARVMGTIVGLAALFLMTVVGAQTSTNQHHGLFLFGHHHGNSATSNSTTSSSTTSRGSKGASSLFSHHGTGSAMSGMTGGAIIGNRRTHVYHLPGDTGNLPDAKNRIYFRTEAQAWGAGYHAAGGSHGSSRRTHGAAMSHPMQDHTMEHGLFHHHS